MNFPPGPRGKDVLGFVGLGGENTLEFLERTARRYGPVSSFRILTRRIYFVDDAELIKEILVTRQHSFERDAGAKLLRELVGDSVITREEPEHKERRRMLQPAFHREQIASYARIMAEASGRMAAEWEPGAEIDMREEMRKLTLDIVGACLFGADFAGSAGQVSMVLQRVGKRSRRLAPLFVFLEPLFDAYRRRNPGSPSLLFRKERAELDQILRPVLECERAGAGTGSMLSLLAGEKSVLDEMVTFMLAGHETTASALAWAWYLLARHPEVEEEMAEELRHAPATFSVESLAELPFTGMVFQEALRLYPPALIFGRRTREDVAMGSYTVPKGSSIFLSPYVTQRNPLYFDDPETFRPARWRQYSGPKFAYFPFGAGAKMCIGEPFARLEGVLALATLAKRWRVELLDSSPVGVGPGFLLRPERAIRMRILPNLPSSTATTVASAGYRLPTA